MAQKCLILIFSTIAVASVVAFCFFPLILQYALTLVLPLREGSRAAKFFETPPVDVQWKFYLFNVSNPTVLEKVKDDQEEPPGGFRGIWDLTEVGPFLVEEKRHKKQMSWKMDDSVLQFVSVGEMSLASRDKQLVNVKKMVTTINPIAMTYNKLFQDSPLSKISAGQKIEDKALAKDSGTSMPNFKLKNPPPYEFKEMTGLSEVVGYAFGSQGGQISPELAFTTHTAEEIILSGYKVKELEQLDQTVRDKYKMDIVPFNPLANNTFSIAQAIHDNTGKLEIYTGLGLGGTDDLQRWGNIKSWKGRPRLSIWNSKAEDGNSCNSLDDSTNGELFPPSLDSSRTLKVWIPTLCRVLTLKYESDQMDGDIKVLRYGLDSETWLAPIAKHGSKCFCYDQKDPICKQHGLLDVGQCMKGSPVYLSQIGLNGVSSKIRKRFRGLKHDVKKHSSFLNVEPVTGLVTSGALRLQLNVFVSERTGLNLSDSAMDPVFFPYARMDIESRLNETFAAELKYGLLAINASKYVMVLAGVVSLITTMCLLCCADSSEPDERKDENGLEEYNMQSFNQSNLQCQSMD